MSITHNATPSGVGWFVRLTDLLAALGGVIVAAGGLFVIWSESRARPVASTDPRQ